MKVDSGRLRPREVKRRSSSFDPADSEITLTERSERALSPSMVAVWSKFLDYEATLPELSSVGLSPEINNVAGDSYSTSVRQLLRAGEACRRSRSQPEVLREAYQPEDEAAELTRLSHLQSLAADGTETRLLVESLNRPKGIPGGGGRIFPAEDDDNLILPPHDQSTLLSRSPAVSPPPPQQQPESWRRQGQSNTR